MRQGILKIVLVLLTSALTGCGAPPPSNEAPPSTPAPATAPARPRIVILGDSLTAGLGWAPDEAYPQLFQKRMDDEGLVFEVVNAGVSGETSAGGLRRLGWALGGDVRVLVIALGGNDGLRGVPVAELRKNLSAMIEDARARNIAVILTGMEAPPNFGEAYTTEFRQVYRELADQYQVPFIPFLLEGVAGIEALNQADGIHPTAAGARQIADTVWPVLRDVARKQGPPSGRQGSPAS